MGWADCLLHHPMLGLYMWASREKSGWNQRVRHSFDLDREKKRGVGRFLLFAPQRRWTSLWPQPKQEDAGQDLETGRQGRKASLAYSLLLLL